MPDLTNYINKAKSIVISGSEDFRPFLDAYITDCHEAGKALDHHTYLRATMAGIFEDAIHRTMSLVTDENASRLLIPRLYEQMEKLKQTEAKTGLNLHTPAYATMVIAQALSGETMSEAEVNALEPLDRSVRAYFEMAEEKLIQQYGEPL